MGMSAILVLVAALLGPAVSAGPADRYFKEDHLTGADYIALRSDGTYAITGREHMGVFALESGRWRKKGDRLAFTPSERKKRPYTGSEVAHGKHTFLAFDSEDAPSIVIPIDDTRQQLDSAPDTLPSYVFFEIDRATFERETKQTYPFRTRRPKVRATWHATGDRRLRGNVAGNPERQDISGLP